jgi:hypothetical protein
MITVRKFFCMIGLHAWRHESSSTVVLEEGERPPTQGCDGSDFGAAFPQKWSIEQATITYKCSASGCNATSTKKTIQRIGC